jgi:hypothetical protein
MRVLHVKLALGEPYEKKSFYRGADRKDFKASGEWIKSHGDMPLFRTTLYRLTTFLSIILSI